MEKNKYVIGLSNIDNIADEVVKLFYEPAVISSVCTCTKVRETPMINGKYICSICNKPILQTELITAAGMTSSGLNSNNLSN